MLFGAAHLEQGYLEGLQLKFHANGHIRDYRFLAD
jgi:hypothetical protein